MICRCFAPLNPAHPNLKVHYERLLNSTCWYMNGELICGSSCLFNEFIGLFAGTLAYSKITVALNTFSVDEIVENLENCLKGVAVKVLRVRR